MHSQKKDYGDDVQAKNSALTISMIRTIFRPSA